MTEVIRVDGIVTMFGEHPVSIAPNGYHYTKIDGKRRLLHHVIAEETLGRELAKDERVYFEDKDRNNFDPANISVRKKSNGKGNRIEYLEARIVQDVEELYELRGLVGTRQVLKKIIAELGDI